MVGWCYQAPTRGFNHPIWKKNVKLDHCPKVRGENKILVDLYILAFISPISTREKWRPQAIPAQTKLQPRCKACSNSPGDTLQRRRGFSQTEVWCPSLRVKITGPQKSCQKLLIHPRKLRWNRKIPLLEKEKPCTNPPIFGFHVSFPGSTTQHFFIIFSSFSVLIMYIQSHGCEVFFVFSTDWIFIPSPKKKL